MRLFALLSLGAVASALPASLLARQEEAEDPNKIDQDGAFGTAIALQGGNIQQDTKFPPGVSFCYCLRVVFCTCHCPSHLTTQTNGALEVEFADANGRILVVTENKKPAAAPAGFTALEPVSYQVRILGGSSKNLVVSKIDYIGNAGGAADLSQAQLARLDTSKNAFVLGKKVVEAEFEADENELSSTVSNLQGEYAFFVPNAAQAAVAAAAAAAGTGCAAAGNASSSASSSSSSTSSKSSATASSSQSSATKSAARATVTAAASAA